MQAGWTGLALDTMTLRALALHAIGERPAADETLRRALVLAEPEGFTRVFLDNGALMERLLAYDAAC